MGYSREVYRRAEAVLAKRRADAEAQAQERRAAFFAACPRAEEIERLLARTSVAAARTVLAGGNVRETLIKLKEQNQALQAEQAELLRGAGLPADALQRAIIVPPAATPATSTAGAATACAKRCATRPAASSTSSLPFRSPHLKAFRSTITRPIPFRHGAHPVQLHGLRKAFFRRLAEPDHDGQYGVGQDAPFPGHRAGSDRKGFGVVYGSVNNLIDKLEREHFGREEESSTRQSLMECDLLILDDLGTEFRTAFSSAELYNLVNTRQMAHRPTIISTNLTMRELESAYSSRFTRASLPTMCAACSPERHPAEETHAGRLAPSQGK